MAGRKRFQQPDGLILGRAAELAAIDGCLDGLEHGVGAMVALTGESGIGKSLLLSRMTREAQARGFTVLQGRGTEFERDVPFGLVIDAFDRPLAAVPPECLQTLGPARLAELASILPSLSGRGGALSSGLQIERFRAHLALRTALDTLAGEDSLMVALDDLHWADQASLEFVCHLIRRRTRNPLILALAYRSSTASRLLSDTTAAAVRDGSLTELPLSPLDASDAEALLDVNLDPALRRALYHESGGNPFYLIELGRAAARRGPQRPNHGHAARNGPVPRSVAAAIREELATLPAGPDVLLYAGAVAGEPFDLDLATEIAELSPVDGEAAVDELLRRGLIRETEVPLQFQFRHPVVRRAVYEAAGEAWRLSAHGRAADALERRGAPVTIRAHHVERSASWGDERAIAVLTEAANAVGARAPAAAAGWLGAARRLLPGAASDERRLSLLVPLAAALDACGRIDEARAALLDALALVPEELPVVRARLVGSIARMDHKLRRHSRARALLDQALAQLEARSGSGITVLRLELAIDSWLTGDWRRMAATAEQALAEARASADPLLIGTAAAIFALAMYFDGETDRAAALVDESANSLDPLPDASLAARVEALMCLGHAELGIERFAAASAHLERGIAIARSTGQNSWFAMLTCVLGVTELRRGRLASAERTGEEAFEAAILAEDEPQIWALTLQTWIATAQGQLDRAIALGERAIELESRAESLGFRWTPHCSLGAAVLEAGDPTRAVAEILGHAGGPGLDAIERTLRPRYFELLALAQIAEGDLIAAEVSVHRAERTAAGLRLKGRTAEARRARAAVELARGAPAIAERAAREAARLFEAVERPVDCARAQVILARALAASGERAAAESLLERAHAGFDDCGAVRDRDAAARELRRLGRRVARPGSHRAAGRIGPLTRREREVAELAARGASNREIADELFISPKTVEAHLARTFAKLGIRSRAALATAIEREPARA